MEKGLDPNDIYLYATVNMKWFDNYSDIDIIADVRCKMHIVSPASGNKKIEMKLELDMVAGSFIQKMRIYAEVDAATGACTLIDNQGGNDASDIGISLTEIGSDGSITNTNIWKYGNRSQLYVAYGDDTAGGIASNFRDDSVPSTPIDNYWGEYYDSNGNIIYRANGQTELWAPDTTSSTNLYTVLGSPSSAPEIIFVGAKWNSGAAKYDYAVSTDKITWIAFNSNSSDSWAWGWYSKKGSNWAFGDAYYYWQNYENGTAGGYDFIYQLYAGFRVPEPITFNSKTYYVSNEYPLRNLLPIADAYKNTFAIKQKEGETYTYPAWTDPDGTQHTNSWTNYTYWLENLNATDPKVETCDIADGDINLNDKLSQYDMYYYNAGVMSKIHSYLFRTTSNLPPYFSNPGTIAGYVKTNLEDAMKRAAVIDYSSYADYIKDSLASDPIVMAMTF
jgi:hypothetical protein